MKTKEEYQQNMRPESSIKAFTKEDINDNQKGDMERYFKVKRQNYLRSYA